MTATFTPQTKSATSVFTTPTRNVVTEYAQTKAGTGWRYNQIGITYNDLIDESSGNAIFYNSEGLSSIITNLPKL